MGIPIIGDILDTIGGLAGKVIVDKDKRNEIAFKVEELKDKSDERFHAELMGQIDINKIEAEHASIFVAGWRPFIGWTSGVGLGYHFVASPFVEIIARSLGYTEPMPVLDASTLLTLVLAMLGVGAQRSFDKLKNKDTKRIGKL